MIFVAMTQVIAWSEMADFNVTTLYQVPYAPYVNPRFGESIGMDFVSIYQVSNKTAQVIFFALLAILVKKGKYPWWENIASGGDKA
jgi:hypothetical protein